MEQGSCGIRQLCRRDFFSFLRGVSRVTRETASLGSSRRLAVTQCGWMMGARGEGHRPSQGRGVSQPRYPWLVLSRSRLEETGRKAHQLGSARRGNYVEPRFRLQTPSIPVVFQKPALKCLLSGGTSPQLSDLEGIVQSTKLLISHLYFLWL